MRSSTSSSESRDPGGGSGRALAAALGAVLAAFVLAQVGGFPEPVLTGSIGWTEQYESFRANLRRDGPHELIILGDSIARQGVRPRSMAVALGDRYRRVIHAFNLGSEGVGCRTLPLLARLAYGLDGPEWCVLVVTPGMIAAHPEGKDRREDIVAGSAYGRAVGDPVAWRGRIRRALLDRATLCRLRYVVKGTLCGNPPRTREAMGYHVEAGYTKFPDPPEGPLLWERLLEGYGRWSIDAASVAGLAETVRFARRKGAQVWIAEAPVHPELRSRVPDLEERLEELRTVLRETGRATGAEVLLLGGDLPVTADDFRDTQHLGPEGAERYTRWLTRRMTESLGSGA